MVSDKHAMINDMTHLMSISVMKINSVNDISTLQFIKPDW